MSPTQAIESVLRKYADFSGRASRSEYWWWWGALLVTFIVTGALTAVIGSAGYVVATIVALAVFIPNLAVTVRRLHDTGRSGWWLLIVFVPVIGAIILFVFMLLDSQREANAWGAPPVGSAWAERAA
jgi:uncharacterized membrane protein YhaH (DUF805 family)